MSIQEELEALRTVPGITESDRQLLAQLSLSQEISGYFTDLATRMEAGEPAPQSWDEVWQHVNQIARDKYGCEYGLPLPSATDVKRPMITARGTPLHVILEANAHSDSRLALMRQRIPVRNSWLRLNDEEHFVVQAYDYPRYPEWEDPGDCSDTLIPKPMAMRQWLAGGRMRRFLDTIMMRSGSPQTVEAEFAAMEKLKAMLNSAMWRSYVLNGAFAEHSKKSDLHYIFRKGYPTIVISYHGNDTGKILCCLCLHPFGYYQGTFCGLMCPTDEVIAHLLAMRTDEHDYWSQCGQWQAADPRSGL